MHTHTQRQQKKVFPSAGTAEANFSRSTSRRRKKTRKFSASTCTVYLVSVQLSSPPHRRRFHRRLRIFFRRLLEASRWLSFCGRQSLHKVPQFNEKIIFSTLSSHKSLICGSGKTRLMLTQSEHEVLRLCLWDYVSPHKRWTRKQIFTPLEWLFDALASRKAELFSALGQISMTFEFSATFHCFSARTRRSHCTGMTQIVHKLGACTSSTNLKPHVKSVTVSDDDLTQVIELKSRLNFHQKSLLESHWKKALGRGSCRGSNWEGENFVSRNFYPWQESVQCFASLIPRHRVKTLVEEDVIRRTHAKISKKCHVGGSRVVGISWLLCGKTSELFPFWVHSDLFSRFSFQSIRSSFGVGCQHAWRILRTTD